MVRPIQGLTTMTKTDRIQSQTASARSRRLRKSLLSLSTAAICCSVLATPALAEEQPAPDDETIIVEGSLGALPLEDVGSIFGFDKTIVETPRSASTISAEQIERFGITDIYGLVAQSPGVFTNSFFGVAGALDIRGTPAETYFRGVRRLDNPGNYATPIAASDRIDIVRGPASPIYGPSKTGGYMNFVPKTARAGASFLSESEGQITFTGGSWGKKDLSASIIGPATIGGHEFGYAFFAQVEDSDSYYDNIYLKQTVVQASIDTDFGDGGSLQFGGMYHKFDSPQNGGWNRLTQDLVDNGTYITGQAKPVDLNGDGQLSQQEFDTVGASGGGFNPFGSFGCPAGTATPSPFASGWTDACLTAAFPNLALVNTGTTKLSRRKTLAGREDFVTNEDLLLYFDIKWEFDNDFSITNQLFYEGYENQNENSYGFSQFHDSWVIEDKLVFAKKFTSTAGEFSFQFSPSIRHTDFAHGDDFFYEYFHRVDLTKSYDALSDRLLSTECDCDYSEYYEGKYTNYALAGLADIDLAFGLNVTLGGRYDWIDVESNTPAGVLRFGGADSAKDSDGAFSYTASANYDTGIGLIPYITYAKQSTVIAGQGAEITIGNVDGGSWLSASKLFEVGLKGEFLDKRLYAAINYYKQERTDFNAQSIVTNQAVETKGIEAEIRWAVNDNLLLTASYTNTKVVNLTALEDGTLFSFFGIEDMVNVSNPTLFLGGQPIGLVPIANRNDARRAGIPENLFAFTGTYKFDFGLSVSGSLVAVESVFSGQSQAVKLPSYNLVDLSTAYETGDWLFRLSVKNATNERYFRANFTELFGSTIVLPEKPRSFQFSVIYNF
jgi:iron complex outermembrane recepter protein